MLVSSVPHRAGYPLGDVNHVVGGGRNDGFRIDVRVGLLPPLISAVRHAGGSSLPLDLLLLTRLICVLSCYRPVFETNERFINSDGSTICTAGAVDFVQRWKVRFFQFFSQQKKSYLFLCRPVRAAQPPPGDDRKTTVTLKVTCTNKVGIPPRKTSCCNPLLHLRLTR